MNHKVCCFNNRFLTLVEVPDSFKFVNATVNHLSLRQTINLYPNFIQKIANELERLYKSYRIVAILYNTRMTMMNNFPNGVHKNITYYVYYTTMDDCVIDNVFYEELLNHLTDNLKMSYYVAQVFLQSLRHGFNKPDERISSIVSNYGLRTRHDDLDEIRRLVLNLSAEQKRKIEMFVAKNSTFDSILPNMLLLNVTNCIQQESLSIKHADAKNDTTENEFASSSSLPACSSDGYENEDDEAPAQQQPQHIEHKFRSYTPHMEFQQHFYYCSYGSVVIVDADMRMATFNSLILKNIVLAFLVAEKKVDQIHVYLYIDERKFDQFSKIHIHGKILQFRRHNNFVIDTRSLQISYSIDMSLPYLYSTAPLVIAHALKSTKETFKSKVKAIQLYLIVCTRLLHKILGDWNCICKVLRIIASPYDSSVFYHVLVFINDNDTDFLYEYLPAHGMDNSPCRCSASTQHQPPPIRLPHSQKLWQSRPCVEILFHTHFDWTLLKIHNDFMRRPAALNIFQLYDVYETGKSRIAHLLESKVFKATIDNLTTFKFFHETGLLYPFETSGHEELYIYTLIKMTRIVYRCFVLPLTKLDRLTSRKLLPSKFPLTYAFIDDPLTPTTSVRGPQSTRNLKSVESTERLFDTKVINVTMLMNSFNLCGSEDSQNAMQI